MDELNLENDREFLNSIETILCSSEHNVHEFQDDISQIFAPDALRAASYTKETNDNAREIVELEAKCKELHAQIEYLTKQKEDAFEEIERLRDQILSQNTYCTSLGSALGILTWRASRFPQVVNVWLSNVQDKIGELLSIVNGTFGAFVSTYKSAFPPTSNVEYQFVMGLLGIVTNISARPEGREFLITIPSGTELVQKLIKLTPELPSVPRTVYLKRLILMILYNVSINETGFRYLLESRVADALSHCLDDEASSAEMQLLCLRILQSVTYDLEPEYVRDLIGIIPIERIETMMSASQSDISKAAELVVQHLRQRQNILK
ncbi:hypothetical protein PUN28_015451 [Cardiocondyla obscurior]|uniref:Heat shock factor 2-binding protein n=1 Tax=Cardiocondyla obscurior TaxID=286306 RepID=A0AAW2EUX1_9HYME